MASVRCDGHHKMGEFIASASHRSIVQFVRGPGERSDRKDRPDPWTAVICLPSCAICNGTRSSLTPARPQEQKGHTLGASDAGRRNSRPRLQREQEASPYVFTSERGGPISAKSFGTLFERLGKRAGMPLHHLPAHAAPRLRLRPGECGPRHAGAAGMARAQEHPAHGPLHRAGAG
jgi:hypothetical protein